MKFTSNQLGNREITLSKVTVFLGANGAGKSKVLNEVKQNIEAICPGKKVVYIEGGRAISLQNTLQLTRQNFNQYQDYARAKTTYEKKRQSNLSDRVYDALMVLERKELAIKAEHSDEVEDWNAKGQEGSCPIREVPPLEKLFGLFHEIFPRLRIMYDPNAKTINVRKGASEYSISEMSDGEKQSFSILADFVELGDEYMLIVVDEPELNLHPELAERIWNLIESEFPDRVYCYASHSLSFAMRSQVERVVVLSDDPDNITEIEDPSDFSKVELTEFLGSIPGIIATQNVVVTEGKEKSFDSLFYRWVLGDDQIEVMPAGDCNQVINVCKRGGIWSRIAPKVSLVGVIDRDFGRNQNNVVTVLKYREAESYLAIPSLIIAADSHLCIKEERLSEETVIELILARLEQERHLIYANVVASRCGIRLGVSISRALQNNCDNTEALIICLRTSSQEELAKATEEMGDEAIERVVHEIETEINSIIRDKDWGKALLYVDGKGIGNAIAKNIGVRNAIDLVRSVAANIKIDNVDDVKELSEKLQRTTPNNSIEATPDGAPHG